MCGGGFFAKILSKCHKFGGGVGCGGGEVCEPPNHSQTQGSSAMKLPRGIPLDRNGTVTPKGTPRESVPLRNKVARHGPLRTESKSVYEPPS